MNGISHPVVRMAYGRQQWGTWYANVCPLILGTCADGCKIYRKNPFHINQKGENYVALLIYLFFVNQDFIFVIDNSNVATAISLF